VSEGPRVQRIAEGVIHAACRRLPADVRAERCREWAAELPAILDDETIRPSFLRALRALSFSAGISRTTRRLNRSGQAAARRARKSQWRTGAMRSGLPDIATRAVVGLGIWVMIVVGVITLARLHPGPPGWLLTLFLPLGIGFDAFCLVDIARAAQVRYLPKWAWTVICLIQTPTGGIIYLSVGHIARPRPMPPGDAKP
jgi:hypothetical protein